MTNESLMLKELNNTDAFIPSTQEEIVAFNPGVGDKFEIEIIVTCPFTFITDRTIVTGYVEEGVKVEGSTFELCFIYTGDYGIDGIVSFEESRIIKRLN